MLLPHHLFALETRQTLKSAHMSLQPTKPSVVSPPRRNFDSTRSKQILLLWLPFI